MSRVELSVIDTAHQVRLRTDLLLTVDTTAGPPTLRARFQNSAGQELCSVTLAVDELSARVRTPRSG